MTISCYQKSDKTLFKVRVQIRSSIFSFIRFSEQVSRIHSEAEAVKIQAKLRKKLRRKVAEQEVCMKISGGTWKSVLEDWHRTESEIRVKHGSINQYVLDDYQGAMRKWMERFDFVPCADIKPIDLMQLFNEMADIGLSLTHRRKLKRIIKKVFEHGMIYGMVNLQRNPSHHIVLKSSEEKKPEILNIGEIRKLVEVAFAQNHDWKHIWVMALLTGMRNGELFALKWTDIDWETKTLCVSRSFNSREKRLKATKAGYWRDVPISDDLLRVLDELKSQTGNEEFVLPRLKRWDHGVQAQILGTFCMENGLPSIRFHTLRACFGTQLLRQGTPSAIVMKIAGWRDLKTMQRYIRLAGVEVAGATDKLKVLPPEEAAANVVAFKPRG